MSRSHVPPPTPLDADLEADVRTEDPELVALPSPPREEQRFTVGLMVATIVASLALAFALRGEVTYAVSSATPLELGDLAQATPTADLANRYVRATGLLGTTGAIRYERPMEGDSFRLAPIAGNSRVWIEIRVPEGMEGPKFTPPTTFVGRLVPFSASGIRHAGLSGSVDRAGAEKVPDGAWLLVDGASPRASRWSMALVGLLAYFAAWNGLGIFKLVRKIKDDAAA
jgi:hypothetical protein